MSAFDASNGTLNGGLGVVGPWKRGGHFRLSSPFLAHDLKESPFVQKKRSSRAGMMMHNSTHVMIVYVLDSLTLMT